MANDGVHEFRISGLEKQMADLAAALDELRRTCVTKVDFAVLVTRVDRLEREVKDLRIECAARFAAIEKRLDELERRLEAIEAKMVTRDELRAGISHAFNRGIAVMITVQCALNGGLYALLR